MSSVDILLQQQSLRSGEIQSSDQVPRMSYKEILKTANEVIKGFNKMRQQILNVDLKVDQQQKYPSSKLVETKPSKCQLNGLQSATTSQRGTNNSKQSEMPKKTVLSNVSTNSCRPKREAIAFEIKFDDLKVSTSNKKRLTLASLQKNALKMDNQKSIVLQLEEKQRKAAERRQVCYLLIFILVIDMKYSL